MVNPYRVLWLTCRLLAALAPAASLPGCGDSVVDSRYLGQPLLLVSLGNNEFAIRSQVIVWWTDRFAVAGVTTPEPLDHRREFTEGVRYFAVYEPPPPQAVQSAQRWTVDEGPAALGLWLAVEGPVHDLSKLTAIDGAIQPPFQLVAFTTRSILFVPSGSGVARTAGYHLVTWDCPLKPSATVSLDNLLLRPASNLDGGTTLDAALGPGCR